MDVYEAIVNLNTILILLGTGVLTWMIRQVVPDHIEGTRFWKVGLRILPVSLGMILSIIPGISPMELLPQSLIVGAVAGSLSSSTYGILRSVLSERMKEKLGSPQERERSRSSIPPAYGVNE